MGRSIEQARVLLEDRLRAITMVDVEVDDSDPVKTMNGAGLMGPDRHIVEDAESHGGACLGVMAGRAHRAEGIGDLTAGDRIHRSRKGARCAQGGFTRSRRQDRIGIERHQPRLRHRSEYALDVLEGRRGRFCPVQLGKFRRLQGGQDRCQPCWTLGVPAAHVMGKAGGMSV